MDVLADQLPSAEIGKAVVSKSVYRLDRLDYLRAFAAVIVVIWHGAASSTERPHVFLALLQEGHMGVSLFCVISGFILAYLYYDKNISYQEFMRRRILRIVPLLLLYTILAYETTQEALGDLVTQILLAVRFGVPLQNITSQDWSVFIELQFYLVFPFILAFSKRYGKIYLIGLVALLVLFRFQNYLTQGGAATMGYWTIFGRMDQFLWGMLAGIALKEHMFARIRHSWLSYLIFVSMIVGIMAWAFYYRQTGGFLGPSEPFSSREMTWIFLPSIEGVLWASLIVSYLLLPQHKIIQPFKYFFLSIAYIGRISYSIYLNQFFVIYGYNSLFSFTVGSGATWFENLGLTVMVIIPCIIAMSTLTYFCVELPFMRLKA